MVPDPWEQDVLDHWLAQVDNLGMARPASTICALSVPRQNGKNAVIEMFELYCLTVLGAHILHTAHEVKTARKSFLRLCSFFENRERYPELAAMVLQIRRTNGQEAILLVNGASIEFSARTRGAARGFADIQIVIFDEAQELTSEQSEALISTLAASHTVGGWRQMVYTGTPTPPTSPGDVFERTRNNVLAGNAGDTCWFEWSIESPDKVDISDPEIWARCNPAMGIWLTEEFTAAELSSLTPEGFARERLGWWAERSAQALFARTEWARCQVGPDGVPDQEEAKLSLGVKFDPSSTLVSLAACALPEDGNPHVELLACESLGSGTAWLAEFIMERADRYASVVVDGRSLAGAFCESLSGKVPRRMLHLARTGEVVNAAGTFVDRVRQGTLTWLNDGDGGQDRLCESVLGAVRRPIGTQGAFGIGGEDSTPAEAASLALWGVLNTKRNPKKKARLL